MTADQAALLAAIRRLTIAGAPPTYRALKAELGVRSTGTIHRRLWAPRDLGKVTWTDRRGGLVILEDQVSPTVLNAMSDEALRTTLARITGILAHRRGDYPVAEVLRRTSDALLRSPRTSA